MAMRGFLLILWVTAILIGTCTNDVYALLKHGEVDFDFVSQPQWAGPFSFYALGEISIFESVGHFFMFFILTVLLVVVLQKPVIAGFIALSFGVMIEFLQPFFTRGADVYDVSADLLGILVFLISYFVFKRKARDNYKAVEQVM